MSLPLSRSRVLLATLMLLPGSVRANDLFSARVRPILARHCFKCHGPDEATRKGKLRLDVREEALKAARSGKAALVPGKPAESELLARVRSDDETEVMPPPATKSALTDDEKQILERWIRDGAVYSTHWAFRPVPKAVPVPAVPRPDLARNPIDNFILTRLGREGLEPSREADRLTLVRRVWLDLTGLPPTPEEADEFVADTHPGAYERLVDRLLASPRYGERWARRWLDLARYADTNGYEKDRARSIWPYRDWVIDALNRDLPFDRFTVEQLAGDLLPGATAAQRVATGFHRNTMLNEEGGIDPLEFRFHAVNDRVATTGTVWLGLTVGCAQCHSHKYDPISHKEYYGLFAFLNNADEPELEVPQPATLRRRADLEREAAALEAGLPARFPGGPSQLGDRLAAAQAKWEAEQRGRVLPWEPVRPGGAVSNLPLLTVLPDGSVRASGDMSKRDVYELTLTGDLKGVTAVRLDALADDGLPRRGPGRVYYEGPAGDFFLSEVTARADGKPARFARASHSFAKGGSGAEKALDGDPQTGWAIDGGQGRDHHAVFSFASPLGDVKNLHLSLVFERYYAAGLGRFRLSLTRALAGTQLAGPAAHDLPAEVELALLASKPTPEQKAALRAHFLRSTPQLAEARKPLDELRRRIPALPTTLVMQERPAGNPRLTHRHHRGEYLQPRETVKAGVPAVFPPLPPGSADRLAFARWLVSTENPLTARVTVNRHWAAFFGRGLVRTQEDFGLQGEAPSHPELLDWLAGEFVRRGWSVKDLHRLIVTSATYRQASGVTPAWLAKDPDNRLLARGPRVRLEGEVVRDAALRSADLLAERLGGPSVFPPQVAGVTTEGTYGALAWNVSPGADRHRRGLYTFAKRTAPFAFFSTFDGPSGEVCQARRDSSNTPLQALMLLNDPSLVEAVQALGRLTAQSGGDDRARLTGLFRRILTRPPTDGEAAVLLDFYRAQYDRFRRGEVKADLVAGSGGPGVKERAAWTAAARVIMNLDELVTRR